MRFAQWAGQFDQRGMEVNARFGRAFGLGKHTLRVLPAFHVAEKQHGRNRRAVDMNLRYAVADNQVRPDAQINRLHNFFHYRDNGRGRLSQNRFHRRLASNNNGRSHPGLRLHSLRFAPSLIAAAVAALTIARFRGSGGFVLVRVVVRIAVCLASRRLSIRFAPYRFNSVVAPFSDIRILPLGNRGRHRRRGQLAVRFGHNLQARQ